MGSVYAADKERETAEGGNVVFFPLDTSAPDNIDQARARLSAALAAKAAAKTDQEPPLTVKWTQVPL